jgi:hypothetical protein
MGYTDPGTTVFGGIIIARFDQNGTFLGLTELDLDDDPANSSTTFSEQSLHLVYDENLNRYVVSVYMVGNMPFLLDGTANAGSMLLAAIDLQGNTIWRQENRQPGSRILALEVDNNSEIYITGNNFYFDDTASGSDSFAGYVFDQVIAGGNPVPGGNAPFTMRLDGSGNLVWGTNKDQNGARLGRDILLLDNEVLTCHSFTGTDTWDGQSIAHTVTGRDAAIVRYDRANGAVIDIWAIESGGGMDEITAMARTPDDRLVVGGYMESNQMFTGSGQPTISKNGGPSDFYVALSTTTLALPSASREGITFYPNPVNDLLSVSGLEQPCNYRLLDLQGRQVAAGTLDPDGSIPMNAYNPGIYLLELQTAQGRLLEKVVVE